jgi:tetratricopeptide (TPR) repeat protein
LSAGSKNRYFGFAAAALLAAGYAGGAESSNSVTRIIREAENLSSEQDRAGAANLILRQLKKTSAPKEARVLKEKLQFFTRYFYSEKGFQSYLVGKELFEKKNYRDALDKFSEADELEKDNVDVLHFMALTQLALGRADMAEGANKRALQMIPFDPELTRNLLAIQVAQEKWTEAVKTSDTLIKEHADGEAQSLKDRGLALLKVELKADARKYLELALAKDKAFPEPYYWLADLKEAAKETAETRKLLTKYVELCKDKVNLKYIREPNACIHLPEAEKKLK